MMKWYKNLFTGFLLATSLIAVTSCKDSDETQTPTSEAPVEEFVVKFNSDGGSKVDSVTLKKGEKVSKPAEPVKSGYEFLGWYLNDELYDFNKEVTSNIELLAKWKKVDEVTKYTVTFDSNGGSSVQSVTINEGEKVTKPADPTKDGYIFLGWFLNDVLYNFDTVVTNNITLVAKWQEDKQDSYLLTINYHVGSEVVYQLESDLSLFTFYTPEVELGYGFKGWYYDETLTNAASEDDIRNMVLTENKTLDLYASIDKIGEVYTVKFVTNSSDVIDDVKVLENTKVTKPTDPVKEGYTFLGWFESEVDEVAFDFNNVITSNLSLYAKWAKDYKLTITYMVDDTLYKTEEFNKSQDFKFCTSPRKDGYTFEGWTNEEGKLLAETDIKILILASDTTIVLKALFKENLKSHFNNSLQDDGPLTTDMFPSLGNPHILVIPINLNSVNKTDALKNDITLAFKGTEEETGWESVKSYYYESSYGKLDMEADILDWYTPKNDLSYYENYYDEQTYEDGSNILLYEALSYYDTSVDFSKYDYDKDGILDGVWLVYNCDVDFYGNSLWWAFTSWASRDVTFDGVTPYTYAFAGTDFLSDKSVDYDTTNIKVDAHTYIHETGHLMGLDDYYDYEASVGAKTGGLYGADMMDYNVGDHSSISKLLLGWIDPIVVNDTKRIDIRPFVKTGDVLLITNHELKSIYEEYFLVEFYTTEGLNLNDKPIKGNKNAYGVRVLHIVALPNVDQNGEFVIDGEYYQTAFKYDNTETDYKFVNMLRADLSGGYKEDEYPTDKALFTLTSKKLGVDIYKDYKLTTGESLFFNIVIEDMSVTNVTIKVNFNHNYDSGSGDLPLI